MYLEVVKANTKHFNMMSLRWRLGQPIHVMAEIVGESHTTVASETRDPHDVIDRGSDALDQSRRQRMHHLSVLLREGRFEKDGRVSESLHAGEFSDGEKAVSR